jgi:ketosteroid isomerase-like protein
MSLQSLAQQFVDLCNQGKNFDVMETMYSDDIVSVEADGREVKGKGPVIQKSRNWAAANEIHGGKCVGPYFSAQNVDDGQFAVTFHFEITPKATGKRITANEVGLYTVKGGKITREQFFYEGKW